MGALRGIDCDRSCSNASASTNGNTVMSFQLGKRFKKTDDEAREGGVVENLSEEFDPGSD